MPEDANLIKRTKIRFTNFMIQFRAFASVKIRSMIFGMSPKPKVSSEQKAEMQREIDRNKINFNLDFQSHEEDRDDDLKDIQVYLENNKESQNESNSESKLYFLYC